MPEFSAAVLAGGQSRRMGRDKAFIPVGGRLIIERVLGALEELSDDLLIVTNTPELYASFGVRLVGDIYPGKGALGGIFTAIQAAHSAYVFVIACDMPFLNVQLLRYMEVLASGHDVVIPRTDKSERTSTAVLRATAKVRDLHPLHALYSKNCLPAIERALQAGDLRAIAFLPGVRVCYMGREEIDVFDPEHLSFFNVNTPEELALAEKIAAGASEQK